MIPLIDLSHLRRYDLALEEGGRVVDVIDEVGFRVASFVRSTMGPVYGKRILVLMGKGNNGADALAAARYLRQFGASVEEARFNWSDAPYSGTDYDLIIDGVFGTGISRGLQGKVIEASGAKIVSIDIPSGVDLDRVVQDENCVNADVTLIIGALKVGQLNRGTVELMGEAYLWCFDDLNEAKGDQGLFEVSDIVFRGESLSEHKWKRAVHVVAGSQTTIGASLLAGEAALHSGAGLVRVSGNFERPDLLQAAHPGLLVGDEKSFERDISTLSRYGAVVIGPGLGELSGQLLEQVLVNFAGPLVIDADAISAISQSDLLKELLKKYKYPVLLTPHDGEVTRLFTSVGLDLSDASFKSFVSDFGVDLLHKGFPTRIFTSDRRIVYVTSNSSNLSVAGSGDVLSGMIGAFIARNGYSVETVASATYIHGLSGGRSVTNPISMIDSVAGLIEAIPKFRTNAVKLSGGFRPIVSRGPLTSVTDSKLQWSYRW
ncbi:MAG: NAD(P)H-hydrate dehydratase [Actinomycetota bacterium]|nr:NAD(P)H-hydrate dehydratase [Actinomycetota bacterium]